MKPHFIIILLFTFACSKLDHRLSVADLDTLRQLTNSRSTMIQSVSHLGIEQIRLSENGSYFVVNYFFTDESGYFVLVSGELPRVTGSFKQINNNVYTYQIKG